MFVWSFGIQQAHYSQWHGYITWVMTELWVCAANSGSLCIISFSSSLFFFLSLNHCAMLNTTVLCLAIGRYVFQWLNEERLIFVLYVVACQENHPTLIAPRSKLWKTRQLCRANMKEAKKSPLANVQRQNTRQVETCRKYIWQQYSGLAALSWRTNCNKAKRLAAAAASWVHVKTWRSLLSAFVLCAEKPPFFFIASAHQLIPIPSLPQQWLSCTQKPLLSSSTPPPHPRPVLSLPRSRLFFCRDLFLCSFVFVPLRLVSFFSPSLCRRLLLVPVFFSSTFDSDPAPERKHSDDRER